MPILCATRFNNVTFQEYIRWIEANMKIIYNTPVKISEIILSNEIIYILEMNNSENTIEGIGIIKNKCISNQKT